MSELWIRNPGAGEQYGPVTLGRLRTMIRVGLIQEQTVAHDGRCDWRTISRWPELMAALEDPVAETWVGAPERPALKRDAKAFEIATTPVAPTFDERPVLRLGRAVPAASEEDRAPAPSVAEVLALNVACAPPSVPEAVPWRRHPWARNLGRWLAVVGPLTALYALALAAGWTRAADMREEDRIALTFYLCLLALWTCEVWIISPARWRMYDRKTGRELKPWGAK